MIDRTAFSRALKEVAFGLLGSLSLLIVYFAVRTFVVPNTTKEDLAYIAGAKQRVMAYPLIHPGSKLPLPGEGHNPSLVLIISPDCSACVASAPFHKALFEATARQGIQLYVAMPEIGKGLEFLKEQGLSRARMVGWTGLANRPAGTPTLLLVSSKNIVRKIWFGKLSEQGKAEALEMIKDPGQSLAPRRLFNAIMMTSKELKERVTRARHAINIVNINPRGVFAADAYPAKARNIPSDELHLRAQLELDRHDLQVIDCTYVDDMTCSTAMTFLAQEGFSVFPLDYSIEDSDNGKKL